jgi:ABC-type transporter Mla maintaining outer membrane lipid asymmetry permease subunit MlaE
MAQRSAQKVCEQIDAMRARHRSLHQLSPRLYTTVFMLFFLTILSDALASLAPLLSPS